MGCADSKHAVNTTEPINVKPVNADDKQSIAKQTTKTNGRDASAPVRTEDKYQIMKTLGEGASCKVLSVRDRSTHQLYAMKQLNRSEKYNATLYQNEVAILNKLGQHPNILELVTSYETRVEYNIVTVLYNGGELFDQVANGSFSEKIASQLAQQMLSALAYCHQNNIVHRDLKPENFVFDSVTTNTHMDTLGNMRLIDFGCAKLCDNLNTPITDVAGSPYYCAPEVLSESYIRTGEIWQCSDMWSIGVIIFLLVSGFPPFNGDSQDIIFRKIKRGKYRFPSSTPALSDSVKDLVNKMLRMNPKERITAADALQHEWIRGVTASDTPLPATLVTALNAFRTQCRLKKAVARVLCNRMTDDDKHQLADVFTQFDRNGDGTLGADEIAAMMKHIGKTDQHATEFMADLDEDGDGNVTIAEFNQAAIQGRLGSSTQDEMKAAFDIFDLDGDGFVTQHEIERVCEFLTPAAAQDLIAEVDKNSDGKINFSEWIKAMNDINERVDAAAGPVQRTKTSVIKTNTKNSSVAA